MTKAEILKKHKMTEQEFYMKYPTQESYIKEFGDGGSITKYQTGGKTKKGNVSLEQETNLQKNFPFDESKTQNSFGKHDLQMFTNQKSPYDYLTSKSGIKFEKNLNKNTKLNFSGGAENYTNYGVTEKVILDPAYGPTNTKYTTWDKKPVFTRTNFTKPYFKGEIDYSKSSKNKNITKSIDAGISGGLMDDAVYIAGNIRPSINYEFGDYYNKNKKNFSVEGGLNMQLPFLNKPLNPNPDNPNQGTSVAMNYMQKLSPYVKGYYNKNKKGLTGNIGVESNMAGGLNYASAGIGYNFAEGGMMPKTSTRITPEITRLSKGGKLMTYDNGGNLTYDQQIALQNNQAELDAKNTAAQNKYTEGQQKIATTKANNITSANAIAGVLGNSLNPIENSNTGNKQMDYYNNKISKDSKMASTALGLAGAGIGSLIAPGVGTSIGASLGQKAGGLFAKGGNMQVPMNIVNADNKPQLTKYSGLKHSEGGIALGNTGNEVEDKETRVGDFIFSEKLKASKNTSFADMSKRIEKQTVGRRDNDSISKETFNRKISNLASVQEASKAANNMTNNTTEYGIGGFFDNVKKYFSHDDYTTTPAAPGSPNANSAYPYDVTYKRKPSQFENDFVNRNQKKEIQNSQSFYNPAQEYNDANPTFKMDNNQLNSSEITSYVNPKGKDVTIDLASQNPIKDDLGFNTGYNKYKNISTNFKNKKNLDLSWLNPAAQLGLTALGNYKPLPVKNYQMKPELLDSTQAKRENRDAFSGLNSDLATSGLSGGQYLASRMGSAAQQAGENAKIDNQYRTANVGIKNQFKQMNTATDKEVQELNAREIDASKTARQMRNQNMAGILGGYGANRTLQNSTLPQGHEWVTDKLGRKIGHKKIGDITNSSFKVTGSF